jgi:glycosyltransferase involved in cell wall biosynthesis
MKLALCLVTLNELEGCKQDVPRLPRGEFEQVYAVDGGSTDGTREYLETQGIPVYEQDLRGYNGAYITAFRRCEADALVLFHPKGTIDPSATLRFRSHFEAGAQVVISSRIARGGHNEEDERRLKPRKWATMGLALLSAVLWRREGPIVWDILHGFRGMSRSAFFAIDPLPRGLSIDLEIVVRSYRLGLRRTEFPVVEGTRQNGTTHFKALPTGKRLLRYLAFELRRSVVASADPTRGA